MINEALVLISQNIIELTFAVLLPAVLRSVWAWGSVRFSEAEAQLNDTQQYLIREFALTAVKASEQLGVSEQIVNAGEAKYTLAVEFLSTQLERIGVSLSDTQIRAYIESAVFQLFGQDDIVG